MMWNKKYFLVLGTLGSFLFCNGCSSLQQKGPGLELEGVYGKKVALMEIEALPATAKLVRSSLLGLLTKRGTFVLLSDYAAREAREKHLGNLDLKSIAKEIGANYMLRVKVIRIKPEVISFLSQKELLSEAGQVELQLEFTHLKDGSVFIAKADAQDHLKTKETSLELEDRLLRQAFSQFFRRYIAGERHSFYDGVE